MMPASAQVSVCRARKKGEIINYKKTDGKKEKEDSR
jgi:hypothetical protein